MIKPLYDRVVVRRIKEEEKIGSFYVPDSSKEKPSQGVILAVGVGRKPDSGGTIPLEVEVNDKVLFGKYSGTEVEVEGEKLLILREEEIMAIL